MKLVIAAVLALGVGAVLGMLGGGGAILTTPMLAYVVGLPAKQAIVGALFVVATTSAVSAVMHARQGNVRPRIGLVFGGVGMAFAYLGGRATHLVPGPVLLVLLSLVMLASAVTMLRKKKGGAEDGAAPEPALAKIALVGAAVGGLSGFVGAGGGFLIVPALVLFGGVPMRAAVGTSLLVIAMQSTAGLLGQIATTPIEWRVTSIVAACTIVGSFAGARLGAAVKPETLRKAFAALVTVVGLGMLVREGLRLAGVG